MFSNLLQKINIPYNQIGFRDYTQLIAVTPAELFQDGSGNFVTAFRWLVWIGCGAHGNRLPAREWRRFRRRRGVGEWFVLRFWLQSYAFCHCNESVGVRGEALLLA